MTFLTVFIFGCLCTLGGASFRAVDRFSASQEQRPALRGAVQIQSMPALPAIVHNVDSADTAPAVPQGFSANKKAHPSHFAANGWVSSSEVIRKL